MFQLSKAEKEQVVTNCDHLKSLIFSPQLPYAFTEHGVTMSSCVLNSARAVRISIAIVRAFVRIREILLTHTDLAAKIEALELKYKNHDIKLDEYDKHIAAIFEAIKQLIAPPSVSEKPRIGFK